jgi:hypothetical protein
LTPTSEPLKATTTRDKGVVVDQEEYKKAKEGIEAKEKFNKELSHRLDEERVAITTTEEISSNNHTCCDCYRAICTCRKGKG